MWTDAELLRRPNAEGSFYFQDLGCLVDRRLSEGKTIAFSAKGGHNSESHNHNDLGHFILHLGGESLLADLGAGLYSMNYFGVKRYDILNNASEGHSMPIINGHQQKAGRSYASEVVLYEQEGENQFFELDLTKAYDDVNLIRFNRSFRWSWNPPSGDKACLQLEDTFSFALSK